MGGIRIGIGRRHAVCCRVAPHPEDRWLRCQRGIPAQSGNPGHQADPLCKLIGTACAIRLMRSAPPRGRSRPEKPGSARRQRHPRPSHQPMRRRRPSGCPDRGGGGSVWERTAFSKAGWRLRNSLFRGGRNTLPVVEMPLLLGLCRIHLPLLPSRRALPAGMGASLRFQQMIFWPRAPSLKDA